MRHLLMVVFLMALSIATSWAKDDHEQARQLLDAGQIVPLEQILDRARERRPGRLLEAELKQKKQRYIYEIELVDPQGVVWELKYDAASGALIKEEQDD